MAQSGGQPGNQNAKKAKLFESAIKRALARKYGTVEDGLDKICDHLVEDAGEKKDPFARREIADRIDGKPPQAMTVGGDEDNPLRITGVTRKIVDPGNTGQP